MKLWGMMVLVVLAAACGPTTAAYQVDGLKPLAADAVQVKVNDLADARPEEEHTGVVKNVFGTATRDAIFKEPVASGVTSSLTQELQYQGLNAGRQAQGDYVVGGTVKHYVAVLRTPPETYIPFVSYVTWIGNTDTVTVRVAVQLDVTGPRGQILSKEYSLERDTAVSVGALGFESKMRMMDSSMMVDLLHTALDDVLTPAAAEIRAAIEADKRR